MKILESRVKNRFPTMCQKNNTRCGRPPMNLEPKTASAFPAIIGLRSKGYSFGSYSRSASCTNTISPRAAAKPLRKAGATYRTIIAGNADAVFGSRFMGGRPRRVLFFWHMVGNRFLTLLSNIFTNLNLTDMETCYKAFRTPIIQSIQIEEDRFGFEPEIIAKLAKRRCRIYEVGISYNGRTYQEGEKDNLERWIEGRLRYFEI